MNSVVISKGKKKNLSFSISRSLSAGSKYSSEKGGAGLALRSGIDNYYTEF